MQKEGQQFGNNLVVDAACLSIPGPRVTLYRCWTV